MKVFLDAGMVIETEEDGESPLHTEARWATNPSVVKVLLAGGADPNARDKDGKTPLHRAAAVGENSPVVKVLLDAGADLRAKTKEGRIPVELIPDDSP